MKRILMILTSHGGLIDTDDTTGVWLGEFTDPYYRFLDEGFAITLASPDGGQPPVDPKSKLTENITASNRRFQEDQQAQQKFSSTYLLNQVKADDFDALFFPGGHGPMFDLAQSEAAGQLILDFLDQQKPVGAVCHGPAAFIPAANLRPEFIRGKTVTAFTDAEEKLVMMKDNIPFSLEESLKEMGAKFESALVPFTSKVCVDGLLVTGQNPASAEPAAEKLIELLPVEAHP